MITPIYKFFKVKSHFSFDGVSRRHYFNTSNLSKKVQELFLNAEDVGIIVGSYSTLLTKEEVLDIINEFDVTHIDVDFIYGDDFISNYILIIFKGTERYMITLIKEALRWIEVL